MDKNSFERVRQTAYSNTLKKARFGQHLEVSGRLVMIFEQLGY